MYILASQNCSADIIMICSVQQSKTIDQEITLNPKTVTMPSFLMLSHDNFKRGFFFIFVFDMSIRQPQITPVVGKYTFDLLLLILCSCCDYM